MDRDSSTPTRNPDFWTGFGDPEYTEPPDRRRLVWIVVLVGAVVLGSGIGYGLGSTGVARELVSSETAPSPATPSAPTVQPQTIELPLTPAPTPVPTARPTARPTAQPSPEPAAGSSFTVSASATCGSAALTVSYSASSGEGLRWVSVYVDGASVVDKPVSGNKHSGSAETTVEPGGHDVEVVASDTSGAREAERFHKRCT